MATQQYIDGILKYIKGQNVPIEFNKKLFEISEGNLLKYVAETLSRQLSADSAKIAIERAAPINVWNKIIKKLSTLYSRPVVRKTELDSDQELVDYYVARGIDKHFGNMNENYNSYKWSTLEIYEDDVEKALAFRSVPSHQFIPYSDDKINPLRPTAIVKLMGKEADVHGAEREKFWIYTPTEFIPVYDNGDIVQSDMDGNDGVNPFEVMPFEYISMSQYLLIPTPDDDSIQMTVLTPILLTDINYGSMFLSFPLLYTIDADSENLPASPNIFWNLKSDDPDKTPSAGVVKAEPNLDAQMNHVMSQLAIWLDSKDIKPGTVGKLTAENFASGISKIISEMDTLENRKGQEIVFSEMETKCWCRIAQIHNTLAKVGRISNRKLFSDPDSLVVMAEYSEDKVLETRADKVERLAKERDARFTSQKKAIKELNPKMDDKAVDELIKEIDEEQTTTLEVDDGDTTAEIPIDNR